MHPKLDKGREMGEYTQMEALTDISTTNPQETKQFPPHTHKPRPTKEQRIKARQAYISGKGSVRVVAQSLSLAYETVQDWSNTEGWMDLRDQYEQRQLEKLLGPPTITPQPAPSAFTINNHQKERLAKQLAAIEELMDGETDGRKLSALATAHSKLFEPYCTLAGIMKPGTARAKRSHRPVMDTQPIGVAPEPIQPGIAPVQDTRPVGWEYDG